MDDPRNNRDSSYGIKCRQFSLRSALIAVTCISIWIGLITGSAFDSLGMMPHQIWESWVCFAIPALICLPIVAVTVMFGKSRLPLIVLFGTAILLFIYRWLLLSTK
jgi:hypothetical protein